MAVDPAVDREHEHSRLGPFWRTLDEIRRVNDETDALLTALESSGPLLDDPAVQRLVAASARPQLRLVVDNTKRGA
jgi:hypothetical protein